MSHGKKVLDVGNCSPDHLSIRSMLLNLFPGVEVLKADDAQSALKTLAKSPADLILVNRKLDCDYSDGTEVIRSIKANPEFSGIPVMLITNHEEYQKEAIAIGALPGFGKLQLREPRTRDLLAAILAPVSTGK